MSTIQGLDDRGVAQTPSTIRICVCAPDEDLRDWIVDELKLITWIGVLELEIVARPIPELLRPERLSLAIVGVDHMNAVDLDALAARTWETPVIAIGSPARQLDEEVRVLDSRPTSRELKQAIRELIYGGARKAAAR